MGTIASVLQWTCKNCNLINPTECLKCLRCGNIRKILESDGLNSISNHHQDYNNDFGDNDETATAKCDSPSSNQHNTLPGYVEITSDG